MDVKLVFEDSATLQLVLFIKYLDLLCQPFLQLEGVYMGLQPMLRFEFSATVVLLIRS